MPNYINDFEIDTQIKNRSKINKDKEENDNTVFSYSKTALMPIIKKEGDWFKGNGGKYKHFFVCAYPYNAICGKKLLKRRAFVGGVMPCPRCEDILPLVRKKQMENKL